MQKRLLITTPLAKTWNIGRPFTLLGRWCFSDPAGINLDKYDCKVEPYHWDDRERLYNDYVKLEALYEELLGDLARALNRIHSVDHDLRYWRILLGPWLGYIIQILYDRWLSIEHASKAECGYETTVINFTPGEFIPNDMSDFGQMLTGDIWNHYIYSIIIKEFPSISVIEEYDYTTAEHFEEKYSTLGIDKKNALLMRAEKILSPIVRNDDNFFIATYIPLWEQLKLQMSLRQFPIIYSSRMLSSSYVPQKDIRDWYLDPVPVRSKRLSAFEYWFRKFIPNQIPMLYLEGYKDQVARINKSHWPKKPKVIWTSNLYHDHDFFKLWAAEKVEQGSRLIIGQHGGNYGMAKWNFSEDHQVNISDVYFSWGWKDDTKHKILPVGQLKSTPIVSRRQSENNRAMLVTMELPRYSYMMMSSVVAGQWLDYLKDQFQFINSLSPMIQEKFTVRLKERKNGWQSFERWRKQFPYLNIDTGKNNYHKEIAKCKIVVSTYNAATYLESMAMNIPTVIFWNPDHWELREDAVKYVDELERVRIFHSSPLSAAQHIENIWNDVYGWWETDSVQSAKDNFCNRYSSLPENMMAHIKDVIATLPCGFDKNN